MMNYEEIRMNECKEYLEVDTLTAWVESLRKVFGDSAVIRAVDPATNKKYEIRFLGDIKRDGEKETTANIGGCF